MSPSRRPTSTGSSTITNAGTGSSGSRTAAGSAEALETQARFEAFMENTPGAAWIKDEFGRYVYANHTIETLLSKTREEVTQKTDGEILDPELASSATQRENWYISYLDSDTT